MSSKRQISRFNITDCSCRSPFFILFHFITLDYISSNYTKKNRVPARDGCAESADIARAAGNRSLHHDASAARESEMISSPSTSTDARRWEANDSKKIFLFAMLKNLFSKLWSTQMISFYISGSFSAPESASTRTATKRILPNVITAMLCRSPSPRAQSHALTHIIHQIPKFCGFSIIKKLFSHIYQ